MTDSHLITFSGNNIFIDFVVHCLLFCYNYSHFVIAYMYIAIRKIIRDYHMGVLVIARSINPRLHYQAREL